MEGYRWLNEQTIDVDIRQAERFHDAEPLTTASVHRAFVEMMRWGAPHSPGTQFNDHPGTTIEVTGDHTVRFRFPRPDGLLAGELRAMHLMTTRFWEDVGFGTTRFGTGDGHW